MMFVLSKKHSPSLYVPAIPQARGRIGDEVVAAAVTAYVLASTGLANVVEVRQVVGQRPLLREHIVRGAMVGVTPGSFGETMSR